MFKRLNNKVYLSLPFILSVNSMQRRMMRKPSSMELILPDLTDHCYRPPLRGQQGHRLKSSWSQSLLTNTGAVVLIAFVFINFLFVGYKLGEMAADSEAAMGYLKKKSNPYYP